MNTRISTLFILFLALATLLPVNLFAAPKQELIYVVNHEADLFDPGITGETYAVPIIVNAFEGLVKIDKAGALVPAAAESWEISDDGLEYTFSLRKGAKWSDGKPLTAADFVFAWTRVLKPETGSKYAEMLFYIKNGKQYYKGEVDEKALGFSAIDNHTIKMTLESPTPYMLQLMTFWVYFPVRKDIVEKNPDGWARKPETYIGNGPFQTTEMNLGQSVVFKKNENYWRADQVKLEKLTIRLIPEMATALIAMEAGDVDGIENVPPAEIPRLQVENDNFVVIPGLGTTYYLMNNQHKPLDDIRVRKALSLAIDRRQLIEHVLQSGDEPAFAIVPYGLSFNGKDFREEGGGYGLTESAQVEQAKALLAEAGYPNGEGFPVLHFKYSSGTIIKKIVEALQQMWKQALNIDFKVSSSEWKVYYPEIQNGDYDIAQMGWGADYAHPMTFLDIFLTNGPNNHTFWASPEYDKFVALSKETTDIGKSVEFMHKAEDVLMNDMAILPLFHRSYAMMMGQHVKGWYRSSLGFIYFEDAYLE